MQTSEIECEWSIAPSDNGRPSLVNIVPGQWLPPIGSSAAFVRQCHPCQLVPAPCLTLAMLSSPAMAAGIISQGPHSHGHQTMADVCHMAAQAAACYTSTRTWAARGSSWRPV